VSTCVYASEVRELHSYEQSADSEQKTSRVSSSYGMYDIYVVLLEDTQNLDVASM